MKQLKRLLTVLLAVMSLQMMGQSKFVTVSDGHFLKDGKPYYYVGTNLWYGAILGSEGQGGNRERLVRELFYDYVRFILGRTNRYTGVAYKDDPAIMSWQIGNEPRAFAKEALPAFEQWLAEASALIRSLDSNHLISIGSEGSWGCEND